MRIAHVTDGYLPRMGGIERQVQGLAHAQQTAGHDVRIITSVAPDDRPSRVPVSGPARSSARAGSIQYLTSFAGRAQVLAGGYDLVHVHASCASPLAWLSATAAGRAGLPTVVTTHSFLSWTSPIFRAADVALNWRTWPITWTSVSQVAAASLAEVVRPDAPIQVIPNGVAAELWRPDRLPRQRDRVVLVSVLRLATRKRPLPLLRMLREIRSQVPPEIALEVKLIGDGPKRGAAEAYLRRHRMAGWVQLTGQLSRRREIRRVYDDADLYLSPATLETFGIAALEARCAGLPVIGFGCTGVADFIGHERNGLLVDSDAGLVAAAVRLIRSPELRRRLTAHNLATDSGFNWAGVLAACDRAYADAHARVGRPLPALPHGVPSRR